MPVVRLSDAYVHDVYGSYFSINSPETTRFFESGVIARSEAFDGIARNGGIQATIPFWNDLDASGEPNYSNDDPADLATADGVTSGRMTARKAWVNKGFGDMDLVQELAGSSPMQHIRSRFDTYWARIFQHRMIAMSLGVRNANIAQDGGDMVVNISALSGSDAVFNSDAFIDAAYTMGQWRENLAAILVHTDIMKRMVKDDEIVYIPDSQGNLTIATYKGMRVIDEQNPQLVSGGVYTSILYGRGAIGWGGAAGSAFAYGEGIPRVPFELWRNPHAGNGGGMEEIWERHTWLLHPFGFSWVEPGSPGLTEFSPTLADLATAARWDRVVQRQLVPLAFIMSRATPAS